MIFDEDIFQMQEVIAIIDNAIAFTKKYLIFIKLQKINRIKRVESYESERNTIQSTATLILKSFMRILEPVKK